MTAPAPITLPDWPRLMSESMAAAYLGIGVSSLRDRGPQPKRLGKRCLYDRLDLDRWADALGGAELDPVQREAEGEDILARVRRRLANGQG